MMKCAVAADTAFAAIGHITRGTSTLFSQRSMIHPWAEG